jgi:hypothetical protein
MVDRQWRAASHSHGIAVHKGLNADSRTSISDKRQLSTNSADTRVSRFLGSGRITGYTEVIPLSRKAGQSPTSFKFPITSFLENWGLVCIGHSSALIRSIWTATFFGGQFSSPGGRSGSSGSRQRSGARCGAWNWLFLTRKFCTYRLRVFRKTSRRKVDGR